MSNVNDYKFAKMLDTFKLKVLDNQKKRVSEAEAIMHDPKHQWKDEEQKNLAGVKCEDYKKWLIFYQTFYDEGIELVRQHEGLVNKMSKIYDRWYSDISNDGKQEVEIMSSQAEMLANIFFEIYKELLPCNKITIFPIN